MDSPVHYDLRYMTIKKLHHNPLFLQYSNFRYPSWPGVHSLNIDGLAESLEQAPRANNVSFETHVLPQCVHLRTFTSLPTNQKLITRPRAIAVCRPGAIPGPLYISPFLARISPKTPKTSLPSLAIAERQEGKRRSERPPSPRPILDAKNCTRRCGQAVYQPMEGLR